jgi:hypothetical protein
MPQVLPPTTATATVVSATGSTLPAGTYAVVVTQFNPYGETLYSSETTGLVVGANQGIQITSPLQPGATKIRAYLTLPGGASGSEQQYIESATSPFTISTPATGISVPPQLNRAFLPDADGALISASAVFGWLNDGLRMISRRAGGLLDYSGVGSTSNVPLYLITGEWIEITSIWYDGYWMLGGDRGQFWRRNNITSQILSQATISIVNNQNILEVYPQPARTAASTTLAVNMGATDTSCTVATTGGFLLPFGFFQIDNEIMGYQLITGPVLKNLIRGVGGTAAVAHTAPTAPVQELNIFWSGKRQVEPAYAPGQSATLLPLPSGWDVLLAAYVSGRAKNIEHDGQYWMQLDKMIADAVNDWGKLNKGIARRRQVGPPSSPATYYSDMAGGILINVLTSPVLLVLSVAGGLPLWMQFAFTLCSTLELAWFVMSVRQRVRVGDGMNTCAIQQGPQREHGCRNFVRRVLSHFSPFSKKSPKATETKENNFGLNFIGTVETSSTPYAAVLETQTTLSTLRNFEGGNFRGEVSRFGRLGGKMVPSIKQNQERKS